MTQEHKKKHLDRIVDQFSHQAVPFAEFGIHMDAIDLLKEMSEVNSEDEVLDVACGPPSSRVNSHRMRNALLV